jgi:hypothetical protein
MMRRDLDKPVLIHVCRDRTLSYRTREEPVFNGAALPVFSVETPEEARSLLVLVGKAQYREHPLLPGRTWYRILDVPGVENKPTLEIGELGAVTDHLRTCHEKLRRRTR